MTTAKTIIDRFRTPTIQLVSEPTFAMVPRAATKLGGLPDATAHASWPQHDGKHLDFLGQVNTNECNSLLPGAFPRDLLLQFYYAYDDLPSGRFAIDRPGWQVKALPLAAVVTRHDKNLGPHHFVEEAVTMVLEESIPSPESLLVQSFRLTPTEAEAYFERFASNLERMISAGRGRTHRLLGFPEIIQYDVYAEATNGMRRGNAGEPAYVEPTSADEVLRLYRHWHLIAQLDSLFRTYSPEPSHKRFAYWGDMGKLFFCANADMLDAASIEHAWMIMQS